jgi:Na+-transporting methylmalonyl-CoA/oxaloacetate decarboxylase gamma subunit
MGKETREEVLDTKWMVKFWGIGFVFMLVLSLLVLMLFFGYVGTLFGG